MIHLPRPVRKLPTLFILALLFLAIPIVSYHNTGTQSSLINPCTIKDSSFGKSTDPHVQLLLTEIAKGCGSAVTPTTYHWSGQQFSFDYPSRYLPKETSGPAVAGEEKAFLVSPADPNEWISVDESAATTSELSQVPSVHLRQLNPLQFSVRSAKLAGLNGLEFSEEGREQERSIFVLGGGKLVSITVSSTSFNSLIEKDFETVLNSFKFQ